MGGTKWGYNIFYIQSMMSRIEEYINKPRPHPNERDHN